MEACVTGAAYTSTSSGMGTKTIFNGFPLYGSIDLTGRHPILFDHPMGEHRGGSTVEEKEDPIIYVLPADAEFIDVIAEVVGFGPAELVASLLQADDAGDTLGSGLGDEFPKPVQQRHGAIVFPIENNVDLRHLSLSVIIAN